MEDNDSRKTCKLRVGNGYDVHRIAPGLKMFLGGVEIAGDCGFVAHSDGDAAIHALCDALLGCRAMGDIGRHFPDNSDKWAGADSKDLLRRVVGMVCTDGWTVGNADITIALQRPKLAPYIPQMRSTLASILGIAEDCISVKATTTEEMGFVGRGEGCEAWACATLWRN